MQLTKSLKRTAAPILISRFVQLEFGALGRKIARAFGYQTPANIALEEIKIPDSALVVKTTRLVEQCSPLFLLNHSIRSYCFGVAIARQLNIKADLEVFYLAAIMHDLGLVSPYDQYEGSFEVAGAKVARKFILEQEQTTEKADLIHEAIALHSSVGLAHKKEAEIALLHYGAGVDVIGFRAEDIAPQTRKAIVTAYPRHQFKTEFTKLLDYQIEHKPNCHIAGHCALGFRGKIKDAPFSE